MKAAIYTLGCKVNQYESEEMTEMLTKNGYLVVSPKEDADVYIVNSCTVTAESNRKTRQAVRKFKSAHPDAVIVMTGCVPQAFPEEALSVKEADIILGNKNNRLLVDSLNRYFSEHKNVVNISDHKNDDKYNGGIITEFSGHTRAFVKIQDGCNRFCSYCAIPYARGRSRSKALDDVKAEISSLAKNGFKEVVFVGINLSAYGRDIGCTLADAVVAAENTDGIERIRLGSLEPDHITDEMIDVFSSCKKFCPQFHISLQSGCDTVLKRMNRHYNSAEYASLVEKLRNTFEDASITTDIITGFPGETDEEFRQTVEFAKSIKFEKVHVFPYSIREGTKAAEMAGQILNSVKSARAAELSAVCENLRAEAFGDIIGKTCSVLFEAPKNGYQCGYTKNYTPVTVKTDKCLTGIIKDVKITGVSGENCIGELI
ncbi:MAG: tRNA (N(6)-L-threonylcarbamoyladenosine(37)-C(2))-methylthiotransferase MtaB [Clostridia bacterium]|nr:tRNA (N(6)-L-threonylcarbamoyladenosine(37)-C(2))-methylthiotransferase MtaB [Clostridia bacterium]